jgi:3-methyladenine DNA glycosylase/8-oxoguanine DNA glycosylase
MNLFGALVFQVIGQQISVIAATAIFADDLAGAGAHTEASPPACCWPPQGRADPG